MSLITLDFMDLVMALGLMAIALALAQWQRLGLGRQLMIATLRTIAQLTGIGYLLNVIFALNNPVAVVGILLGMVTIAAIAAQKRIDQKLKGVLPILWGAILTSTLGILLYVNLLIIQPNNWYAPQYVIPLAGIILGNAMNGASLAGERLVSTLKQQRLEVETHLSLGATPEQAVSSYRRQAVRTALIPTLNQMIMVGIVTLPGMITGQILSGVDPLNAASYQILIMFMVALANLLTSLLVTYGLSQKFFNSQGQLILIS
jgi:putative ABC transport system permease protein